jgi:lipopolysaccharide export system protein LptA
VSDATLVGRRQGSKSWEIHARRVIAASDGRTTTFIGVTHGTLYRNGRPAATVSAGKAVYDDTIKTLRVSDGLRLRVNGLVLSTKNLNWSTATGRLRCPGTVTAHWDNGTASVAALEGVLGAERFEGRKARLLARTAEAKAGARPEASLGLLLSQPAPAAATPNYKEVRIENADLWRTDRKARVHTLSGNVILVHGDATLRCGKVVYDQKANKATATGGVKVTTPSNVVEGDSADIDFGARVMRLRGEKGVRIVAVPRADSSTTEAAAPTTIVAKSLDYFYQDKRAEIAGPLTCVNRDQTLTGERAVWLADEETVTVTGGVRGKDDRGQTFEAPSVKISLREGAETLEAPNIRATFLVEEEPEARARP